MTYADKLRQAQESTTEDEVSAHVMDMAEAVDESEEVGQSVLSLNPDATPTDLSAVCCGQIALHPALPNLKQQDHSQNGHPTTASSGQNREERRAHIWRLRMTLQRKIMLECPYLPAVMIAATPRVENVAMAVPLTVP